MDRLDVLPLGPQPVRPDPVSLEKMKFFVFAPMYNHTRRDATAVFQPEGQRFLKHHGQRVGDITLIDNRRLKPFQRRDVLRVLKAYQGACEKVCVALCCHGYKWGLQLGFKLRHAKVLGRHIAELGDRAPHVVLYACDTARDLDRDRKDDLEAFGGDGGFADLLRDAMCRAGAVDCQVDAHTTAGHAGWNPNVRRFEGMGSPVGCIGGQYIVPFPTRELLKGLSPDQKQKKRAAWAGWMEALKTPFRYEFPFMSIGEIHRHLTTPS